MNAAAAPIRFNPLKHHLLFIKQFIEQCSSEDQISKLKTIGGSVTDLYTGRLTINQICSEILAMCNRLGLVNEDRYKAFLDRQSGYFEVFLSDGSGWILRKGTDCRAYIHIHPARHQKGAIRIKASSLKSAVAARMQYGTHTGLKEVNQVRANVLNFGPIRKLDRTHGVGKLLQLI